MALFIFENLKLNKDGYICCSLFSKLYALYQFCCWIRYIRYTPILLLF